MVRLRLRLETGARRPAAALSCKDLGETGTALRPSAGRAGQCSARPAEGKDQNPLGLGLALEHVARRRDEVRTIDRRERVRAGDAQPAARRKPGQSLARFQRGQRTAEAAEVQKCGLGVGRSVVGHDRSAALARGLDRQSLAIFMRLTAGQRESCQ